MAPAAVVDAPAIAKPANRRRVILLALLLVALAVAGKYGYQWFTVGRFMVSTDDAYVKADIAQVAAEVSGRVQQVLVRDHAAVEAGTPLVKLDPEPFKLVLEKAEAELDNARTTVETARAQWLETQSELAEVEAQADYLARQAQRQQALAELRRERGEPRQPGVRDAAWIDDA